MSEIRGEKKKNFVGVYRKGINEGIVKRGFYYCCIDNDKDIEGHSLIIVNAKGVIIYKIKKMSWFNQLKCTLHQHKTVINLFM
jgi:alpha-acetolactate decarboxylase